MVNSVPFNIKLKEKESLRKILKACLTKENFFKLIFLNSLLLFQILIFFAHFLKNFKCVSYKTKYEF